MMRKLAAIGAGLASMTLLAAAAWPADEPAAPAERVRALVELQDRVTAGDAAAYSEQTTVMRALAGELRRAEPEAWKPPRQAHAALLYVLSGGDPGVLQPLVGRGFAAELDGPLARGVLAFGQNERAEAQRLLETIDALTLEASLGAAVALARASLLLEPDPAAAMRLLDEARLLAPGGRIEEAALRRQALLAMGSNDIVRATAHARRYFRRFPRSVYATPFRQSLAVAFAARAEAASGRHFALFAAALGELSAEQQEETFTALAREALRRGSLSLVQSAAAAALGARAPEASPRATLYAAAVDSASERAAEALATLQAVTRYGLDEEETGVLEAARETAREVLRAPSDGDAPAETANEPALAAPVPEESAALLRRVEHALGTADGLLVEAKP
jgi:chemotaxis protein MotC